MYRLFRRVDYRRHNSTSPSSWHVYARSPPFYFSKRNTNHCFSLKQGSYCIMRFKFKRMLSRGSAIIAIVQIIAILLAAFAVYPFLQANMLFVGPVILLLGLISLGMLKISGRTIRSVIADIVYGVLDVGLLSWVVSVEAVFAGPVGVVFGTVIAHALTDAIAGMAEGHVAAALRNRGIEEARTPISSGLGKMIGGLLGAGIIITFVWLMLGQLVAFE